MIHTKNSKGNPSIMQLYGRPGVLMLTFAIIIIGGIAAYTFLLPRGERINSDGIQVVYMSSGQAYFGNLRNIDGPYLVLETPYTAQNVIPKSEESSSESQQSSTTLLKVSQQQYGPEDVMSLKSDQVLFWQNLRNDSKVVQAIKTAD